MNNRQRRGQWRREDRIQRMRNIVAWLVFILKYLSLVRAVMELDERNSRSVLKSRARMSGSVISTCSTYPRIILVLSEPTRELNSSLKVAAKPIVRP